MCERASGRACVYIAEDTEALSMPRPCVQNFHTFFIRAIYAPAMSLSRVGSFPCARALAVLCFAIPTEDAEANGAEALNFHAFFIRAIYAPAMSLSHVGSFPCARRSPCSALRMPTEDAEANSAEAL